VTQEHVGVWTGPGVLALIDGEWVHYPPRDVPRDLRARASAFVGLDRPTIAIRRAEGSGIPTRTKAKADEEGTSVPARGEWRVDVMAEGTPSEGSDLPEPEWRGLAACDFCGAPLTSPEQLSGACRSCQEKLAEGRMCGSSRR